MFSSCQPCRVQNYDFCLSEEGVIIYPDVILDKRHYEDRHQMMSSQGHASEVSVGLPSSRDQATPETQIASSSLTASCVPDLEVAVPEIWIPSKVRMPSSPLSQSCVPTDTSWNEEGMLPEPFSPSSLSVASCVATEAQWDWNQQHGDSWSPTSPKSPSISSALAWELFDTSPRVREPEPEGGTYTMEVERRDGRSLGAVFDMTDPNLPVVISIEPHSFLEEWNASCPVDRQVKVGHGILNVNGEGESGINMVTKLKELETASVNFKRPLFRSVCFSKEAGRSCGLRLCRTYTGLVVEKVEGSAAVAGVKVSDRVVAVNGKEGSPLELDAVIQSSHQLELKLMSYAE